MPHLCELNKRERHDKSVASNKTGTDCGVEQEGWPHTPGIDGLRARYQVPNITIQTMQRIKCFKPEYCDYGV